MVHETGLRLLPGHIFLVVVALLAFVACEQEAETPTPPPMVSPTPVPSYEEALAGATKVSYYELTVNNADYIDRSVLLVGRASDCRHLFEDPDESGQYFQSARVYTASWYNDVWLDFRAPKVWEDDVIEFIGKVKGQKTLKPSGGGTRTIPQLFSWHVRVVATATPTPTTPEVQQGRTEPFGSGCPE